MVNISKRMHVLKPLLSLRHGPGAAILPQYLPQPDSITASSSAPSQPSSPTLLRVRLTFPSGNGPASKGARGFWRNHLRRLKYHNPALPVTVVSNAEQGTTGTRGPAWRLFLDFEGEEKALRALATEPKNEHFKELMEEELRPRPREGHSMGEEEGSQVSGNQSQKGQSTPAPSSSSSSALSSPAPPAPPAPSDQRPPPPDPQPPTLISTRTVSLPVLNRPANALWFWFQQLTKCIDVPATEADKDLAAELAEHEAKAEVDRKRVKKGIDQIKAKEGMLKMARREVERMKAED